MSNPDFVALAKAMRVHAIRCTSADELPEKMKEFLEYDESRPVLLECVVETKEHVFPMVSISTTAIVRDLTSQLRQVPAGKALHEQILHASLRDSYDPTGATKKA